MSAQIESLVAASAYTATRTADAGRQLQRLNDAGSRVSEREQFAGDLAAVERINGQQIHQSPQDIHMQQIARSRH